MLSREQIEQAYRVEYQSPNIRLFRYITPDQDKTVGNTNLTIQDLENISTMVLYTLGYAPQPKQDNNNA